MKIIIDTHIFLWALADPGKIERHKRAKLETVVNTVYVSSISIVEIMMKASLGKLAINFDPVEMAEKSGFELLDFSPQDALPLKEMPFHHKDPFDRMLIAQCISRQYPIMTHDSKFKLYDCELA
ncbi:MAG: type II toxin-antitoxin system VapC family toxin [Chlorobium sp.]|nr:type II toxin-antitoxin system VapC family toxin [Chlorobium sp.]